MDQSASGDSVAKGRRFLCVVVTTHINFFFEGVNTRVYGERRRAALLPGNAVLRCSLYVPFFHSCQRSWQRLGHWRGHLRTISLFPERLIVCAVANITRQKCVRGPGTENSEFAIRPKRSGRRKRVKYLDHIPLCQK